MSAIADVTKQLVRAQNYQIQLEEIERRRWAVKVPVEHTEHDCVGPAYLWLRHDLIRVGDVAVMVREDYSFYIEALVVRIDQETQSVHTRVINAADFSTEELPQADLSSAVVERSGADNWRVVLGKSVLTKGHATKVDAERWLARRRGDREAA